VVAYGAAFFALAAIVAGDVVGLAVGLVWGLGAGALMLIVVAPQIALGLAAFCGAMLLVPTGVPPLRRASVTLAPLSVLPAVFVGSLGGARLHLLAGSLVFGLVVPLPRLGAEAARANGGEAAEGET
jgi:hypothetical protein